MAKFDGYLICTDLDGTFTVGHDICADNAEYVKYFQENGGLFTVSTGRLPDHVAAFENFVPNCPIISHNGAAVYDLQKNEFLYKSILTEDLSDVIDFILRDGSVKKVWVNTEQDGYDIKSKEDITKIANIFKIVISSEPSPDAARLKNELNERFGDKFCIFLAWATGIEILAKGTNKGTAVTELKKILGDKTKKVITVGDSESDAFMFDAADIGYAVGNASEEAKMKADRVTVDYKKGAIAEIIREIEREIDENN